MALLAIVTLVLMGCTSTVYLNPLSSPNKAQIDKDLLGHWKNASPKHIEDLDISTRPDNKLKAVTTGNKGSKIEYVIFPTKKSKQSYLNVLSSDDKKTSYYLYQYRFSEDKKSFTLLEVSNERISQGIRKKEISGEITSESSHEYAVAEGGDKLLKWMNSLKDSDWYTYETYTREN